MKKLKYVEVKYISHILRNFYLYFILYVSLFLIYDFRLSACSFFKGLFVYVISYSVVYFINDYCDQKEDAKNNKRNLYLSINNNKIFWSIVVILLFFGLMFTYFVSILALFLLIVLLFLNYLYNFRPFHFRNKNFARETNIFVIYFVKWLYILELMDFFEYSYSIPLALLIMGASFASLSTSLYKRHINKHQKSELFYGLIFVMSTILSCVLYKEIIILFLPVVLIIAYIFIKYKNNQIPIGKFQLVFTIYVLIIYLLKIS